jgi:hypothetical protein
MSNVRTNRYRRDLPAAIFGAICTALDEIGPHAIKDKRSQVVISRRTPFAFAWVSKDYPDGDEDVVVLSIQLRRADRSFRWRLVKETYRSYFAHHIELRAAADVDEAVREWLREAWASAG